MKPSKRRVAHFVRKNTQFKASFIRNQIASHVQFEPALVWRSEVSKLHDGGFADFELKALASLNLSIGQSTVEKMLFKGPKVLSGRQVAKVEKFLKEQEIDLCHFHYGSDCGVFFPLLQKIDLPSVVSFYGYDCSSFPDYFFGYGGLYLRRRVFGHITAVLAMSPDMKKDLMKAGCPEEKIIVHYYGTDSKRFYMDRQYEEKSEIRFLILASLVPQKGHLFLLKSFLQLKQSGVENWKLRIVGAGELEETLKAFVRNHGLSAQVDFVGPLPYASAAMMAEYEQADVFVHPSVIAKNGDKEGIPGTVIEAMSAGLPVITTHHAGIPYIIRHGQTGWLVREWQIPALTEALFLLMQDAQLRADMGRAGQTYAVEYLDLQQKELELEEIYTYLLDQHSPAWVADRLRREKIK